jgi:hypothetical protein
MESASLARFRVPSKADIASATDRVTRVRLEAARMNAMTDMQDGLPYQAYRFVSTAVAFSGTVFVTGFVARSLWRGFWRYTFLPMQLYSLAVFAAMAASLLVRMGPQLVAEAWLDATRSPYDVAPARNAAPGPATDPR